MKLSRVELASFELPLRAAVDTARGAHAIRKGVALRIFDDAGRIGLGEATPLPSHGTENLSETRDALARAHSLLGRELDSIDDLQRMLSDWQRTPAARFALELALLDLLAQVRGGSIASLLTDAPRREVPVNALVANADDARAQVARGFRVLKLKVGVEPLEAELARVRSVRSAVGDEVELRLDANGAWSLEAAEAALRALDDAARIALCEQPVATLDELAALRTRTRVPLAADELLADASTAENVIARRAAQVLVLKPTVLGGVLPSLRLARRAAEAGIASLVTTTIDGAIARSGAFALACALPDESPACGLATGELLAADVGSEGFSISHGVARAGPQTATHASLRWEATR